MVDRKLSARTKAEIARGAERVARAVRDKYMERLIEQRKARVVAQPSTANGFPPLNPRFVTIRVGQVFFDDAVGDYPSEKLVANVALALEAGVGQIRDGDIIGATGPGGAVGAKGP